MPDKPDANAQHQPSKDIYDHDSSLASTASMIARERIDAGEEERIVIPEIARNTYRKYRGAPWTIWDSQCRTFTTARMAVDLIDRANAMDKAARRQR